MNEDDIHNPHQRVWGGGRSDWRCPAQTSDVKLWEQMIVRCFPELQLPGFTGVDDPFIKDPEHPTCILSFAMCPAPRLQPAAEPKLWDLLWQMQRQLGEQNLSLP